MSLRSPLGRVRGLGAAREGVGHWWGQRLTALALVPLCLWFVGSLAVMTGAGYETVGAWIASPVVAGLLILLICATFYHAYLGLQVVIEDYIHGKSVRTAALIANTLICWALGLAGVFAVLKIAFGA